MQQASYKGPWGTMTLLEWGPLKCHTYDTHTQKNVNYNTDMVPKPLHIWRNILLFLHSPIVLNFAGSCKHTVCKQQCATWWQHMVPSAWGLVFQSTYGEEGMNTFQTNPIDSSSSAWQSKQREQNCRESVLTLVCSFNTYSMEKLEIKVSCKHLRATCM